MNSPSLAACGPRPTLQQTRANAPGERATPARTACTRLALRAASALGIAALASALAAQNPYSIRRIAPIAPSSGGQATAISDDRVVVGTSGSGTGYVMNQGTIAPLANGPGLFQSEAFGIGPANQVLGSAAGPSGWPQAAIWAQGPGGFTLTLLAPAPGDVFAAARAMSPTGMVAGVSDNALQQRPAIWLPDGGPTAAQALPLLAGDFEGAALGIDAGERVVGWSAQWSLTRATQWTRTAGTWTATALPGLGGSSLAVDVNDAGEICGSSYQPGSGWQMVCWSHATSVVALGQWAGVDTFATAMNNAGDVVGYAGPGGMRTAVARFGGPGATSPVVDLDGLLPPQTPWQRLWGANDINDNGDIVGYGEIAGLLHSFVMTPVDLHLAVGPGAAGAVNTWSVTGATPGEVVLFLVASKGGEVVLPGRTRSLDLESPLVLGAGVADAAGDAACTRFVPDHLLGTTLLHQAFEPMTGDVSDVRSVTF